MAGEVLLALGQWSRDIVCLHFKQTLQYRPTDRRDGVASSTWCRVRKVSASNSDPLSIFSSVTTCR